MKAIDNSGWLSICGGCDCSGFVPSLAYEYDADAQTVKVTDNSDYPGGDEALIVHVYINDRFGNRIYASIDANASPAQTDTGDVDISDLDVSQGFNILATVVSAAKCIADLGVYGLGSATADAGNLS